MNRSVRRPPDQMVVIPPRPRPATAPFDPKLVQGAERADEFGRLVDQDGLDELEAERWLASWERHADRVGLERLARSFWENGAIWIRWQRSLEAEAEAEPEPEAVREPASDPGSR
jgi:hypothetical protein